MTVTPESLAAYADGELVGAEARAIEAEIANDPALQARLAAHRALRSRLSAHFAPIVDQPLPDHLRQAVLVDSGEAQVIDFAAEVRKRRPADGASEFVSEAAASTRPEPQRRRWARIVGPALAASLVLAVIGVNMSAPSDKGYAQAELAMALDAQLVATQPAGAPVRVLLSFRDREGRFCRGFASEVRSGIACRDDLGWQLVKVLGGSQADVAQYRQAGSRDGAVMALSADLAAGPALDAREEETAARSGWRPGRR